jgi:alkylation response protein AidB-like acyl-CoA dehydrogenase
MDLELGPRREELRSEVRRVLSAFDPRRSSVTEVWRALATHGWLDAGALLDAAVVMEEVGRAAAPGPLLAQLEAGLVLRALGAEGKAAVCTSLALLESASLEPAALRARASRRGKDWVVSGRKRFVPHAASARFLLVAARAESGGLGVYRVAADQEGVSARELPALDGAPCEVDLDAARAEPIGLPGDAWPVLERALLRAAILAAAELAGSARAALDQAVEHAKSREQFGAAIGSFQAIQHRLADALIDADAARLAAYDAAARADADDPEWELYASLAKLTASEAARRVTASAHQVGGGVGFYADRDLGLWYKRAKVLESRLGGPDVHRERIARSLGL